MKNKEDKNMWEKTFEEGIKEIEKKCNSIYTVGEKDDLKKLIKKIIKQNGHGKNVDEDRNSGEEY